MSDSDSPTKWIGQVPVQDNTWKWIIDKANKYGKRIEQCAGMMLDELAGSHIMTEYKDDGPVWDFDWFMEKRRRERHAKIAAAIYLENPTEEGALRLERLCDDADVSYDEIVAKVSADPFSSIIANQKTATTRGECALWLIHLLQERSEGVPYSEIRQLAKEMGYSESTLRRAKNDINDNPDTPNIVYDQTGGFSTWMLEKVEQAC